MKTETALITSSPTMAEQLARTLLFKKLDELTDGSVEIVDSEGRWRFPAGAAPRELRATIKIQRPRAYARIAFGGSVGAGESFADGDWDCDDLTNLVRILVRNRNVLTSLDGGWGGLTAPLLKVLHHFSSNTRDGSRKNIRAHYDLGNDFFGLFLDASFLYSSACFPTPETSLEEGQLEKIDRACRKLKLKPTDHLLEIGTGWGALAIHAATKYGCRVTTTTISEQQHAMAKQRIEAAGLTDRIELLKSDYRDLDGKFDKLVSIEMIEAVGLRFLDTFFGKCDSLLKPGGEMLLQSITIREQYFEHASRNVDFIQRHIFPGSAIPSVGSIVGSISRETDFVVTNLEAFGSHYARTLREWNTRFTRNSSRAHELGYDEHLCRLWQFYFSYCEGGFNEKAIDVMQLHLKKVSSGKECA